MDCLRDDGDTYIRAVDEGSRALSYGGGMGVHVGQDAQVDWATLLTLALTCVHSLESTKSRTPGPVIELWQCVQFLVETAERACERPGGDNGSGGHFLTRSIVDTCMSEIMSLLHLDAGGGGAAPAGEKDPIKIQGSIAALASILECLLAYAPYAATVKQEYYHDLFALFSNTLSTLAQLTTSDLYAPHATILSLIKPHSHFPDSFLGLYQTPAAAVGLLVQMVLQYPYTTAASTSPASHAVKKFLSQHVFPFYLSLFTLRVPDNLIARLLGGLNTMLEAHVMSHLSTFRDFSYKFIYAMIQPAAWPKSATIKNELIRFANIVIRVSMQLPTNHTLRIVEGQYLGEVTITDLCLWSVLL